MRSALVDYFREDGRIMIATEAGAEGINLQFCSLVVNYDLPWNPQRIEQRIGRCHRYGQKHDVVVVNFLNQKNEADLRLQHPLAEAVIQQAKTRELPVAEVHFSYGQHEGIISVLEPLIGTTGWLTLCRYTVESLDQAEDHLLFSAVTDAGSLLDPQVIPRLFTLPGRVLGPCAPSAPFTLDAALQDQQAAIQRTISERNARFFESEAEKLDGWADDLKVGLEREIREMDRQIKEARRTATAALTLEEKLAGQKQIKTLESQRNEKRRSLFEAQDRVDQQRAGLIATIEGKLTQTGSAEPLFTRAYA